MYIPIPNATTSALEMTPDLLILRRGQFEIEPKSGKCIFSKMYGWVFERNSIFVCKT